MGDDFWKSAKKNQVTIMVTRYPIQIDYDKIRDKALQYSIKFHEIWMMTDKNGNKILENYHFDITGSKNAERNFYKCYRSNNCITLSHGRMYTCIMPAHLHHLKDYFGISDLYISERNGIDIYKARNAEEITEFLTKPIPVCRYCDLDKKRVYIPFAKSEKKIEEWL